MRVLKDPRHLTLVQDLDDVEGGLEQLITLVNPGLLLVVENDVGATPRLAASVGSLQGRRKDKEAPTCH